ncbi:hypothetical protein DVB69_09950 [Sporosarcina sp. BI001-red]|uniref:hypothetical protein n=1 Tax=Sporosarcina sp. BI001-red TaxID=2282866 RepID=UPI000E277DBF|nr:hypothetical protein [Sporosarcina sp. BI001-red]REB07168.1 hypothetical protein DVB69_09950 [Sporosarcina sp. BI001-red]
MTPYILLLIIALITYAVVFWLTGSGRLPSIAHWIVLLGTSTAFLAMLVSKTMSLWYAMLVILAMSFAMAVLLAKRYEAK